MKWRNVYWRPSAPRNVFWQDFRDLNRNMGFHLGGTRGPVQSRFPALNGYVSDEGLIVTAEVPGVNPEAIEISVVDEKLTISGSRGEEELPEGAKYHRRERGDGDFNRTIELPFKVDIEGIEANFENGILRVFLPRLPEEKPRKIQVKVNEG